VKTKILTFLLIILPLGWVWAKFSRHDRSN
jgi:hypothetical protein